MNTSQTTSNTSETPEPPDKLTCRPAFVTTHWSVVHAPDHNPTLACYGAVAAQELVPYRAHGL